MKLSNKLKFKTAAGHYLVNSWDDVFSIRVCAPEGDDRSNLYLPLHFKCAALRASGKLSGFIWIDDDEHEMDSIFCITRRWARIDSTIFIPNKI